MIRLLLPAVSTLLCSFASNLAASQPTALPRKSAVSSVVKPLTFADVADRALTAPLVAEVRIRQAKAISAKQSPGLKLGTKRYLVTGEVVTLIRGEGGIAPRITWLFDLAPDSRGKFPKLEKAVVSVMAQRVPGQSSEVQLIAPDALFFMTPDAGMRVANIVRSAAHADAPPSITGVSDMYHAPGPVAGEGESQIFLSTANRRPISINVSRAPGKEPNWSISLGETVGESTPPPAKETLLWYRLACSLPATPPATALQTMEEGQHTVLLDDYRFVKDALGPCLRSLPALASLRR